MSLIQITNYLERFLFSRRLVLNCVALFPAIIVVIYGVFLRLKNYTSKDMWWDEVLVYITVKNKSIFEIIDHLTSSTIHQPLYYIVVKFVSIFSRSEAILKIPSLVFGILIIIAIYYIGSKLFDRKVALVAAYLTSISADLIQFSQMLRMYTMLALLCLLSSYMLVEFLNSNGSKRKIWGYIVWTSLALYTHVFTFLLFVSHIGVMAYHVIDKFVIAVSLKFHSVKFKLLVFPVLCFLDFILLRNIIYIQSESKLIGAISDQVFILCLFALFFVVTSMVLSILSTILISNKKIEKKNVATSNIVKGFFISVGCILIISFLVIFSVGNNFNANNLAADEIRYVRESAERIIYLFENLLAGSTQGYELVFGYRRGLVFSFMFLLGIVFLFFRKKNACLVFVFHSISVYLYIYFIGYRIDLGAAGDRHLLFTLPPMILVTSAGIVWGAEYIFDSLKFSVRSIRWLSTKFSLRIPSTFIANFYKIPNIRNTNIALDIVLKKSYWVSKNIFIIGICVLFFYKSHGLDMGSIDRWYSERWQEWKSYGEYVDKYIQPGTLFFFDNQGMKHHASTYMTKESEYLAFHSTNISQGRRRVWLTSCCESPKVAREKYVANLSYGFNMVLDVFSKGRIYEREFVVESPIVITKSKDNVWKYSESFTDYKFVKDSYKITNIELTGLGAGRGINPSLTNESGRLLYKFSVDPSQTIKSFTVKMICNVGRASVLRVKFGRNEENLEEIGAVYGPQTLQLDLPDEVKGQTEFYVEFEMFAKYLQDEFVDSFEKVRLHSIEFTANLL